MITANMDSGKSVCMYTDWHTDMYTHTFYCPACGSEVIPCRGELRRYFRHKSLNDCPYTQYEHEQDTRSIEHEAMKKYLYDAITADCDEVARAKHFGPEHGLISVEYEKFITDGRIKVIPDLYVEYRYCGTINKYAIEIQRSNKTERLILDKNEKYRRLGIMPVWIGATRAHLSHYATVHERNIRIIGETDSQWTLASLRGMLYYEGNQPDKVWEDILNFIPPVGSSRRWWGIRHPDVWFEPTKAEYRRLSATPIPSYRGLSCYVGACLFEGEPFAVYIYLDKHEQDRWNFF